MAFTSGGASLSMTLNCSAELLVSQPVTMYLSSHSLTHLIDPEYELKLLCRITGESASDIVSSHTLIHITKVPSGPCRRRTEATFESPKWQALSMALKLQNQQPSKVPCGPCRWRTEATLEASPCYVMLCYVKRSALLRGWTL